MNRERYSQLIKSKAYDLGFMYCGISKAGFLEEEAPRLEQWLKDNRNGKMGYMENHFDKRLNPTLLVDDAKSVVSLLLNYFPEEQQSDDSFKVSKYAYGADYHNVIKDKLKELYQFIQTEIGEVGGRMFVDSAPVMDKAWAKKSGLGWIGKNSNLIHPKEGSFFFIAELILDLELQEDGPIKDYCGRCTRCIDACPTEAIVEPYVVDGSKCISYLTIELKDALIPGAFHDKMDNWIFGCDVCQDVCPWNRFAKAHQEPAFMPNGQLLGMRKTDWKELTEEVFRELFRNSAVKRTKYSGLIRNIRTIQE
ncbi:tRNA epoxyqueuosine(34) reductase QueG [Crocinitomicaceae bacterium CZZ-1]|uniref:Epoxyqueuosine reductase n=1 Tax=Taishania pollutisoli TaxID=2766479 RepID=A0A8J6PH48_9FLAO|nr:tRNA epoxyqueuosine(34) reductase QueG [Taishania pollutisoli]MBC9811309.1 tRNA epoxyqueuosine(34) reductase QueG [Taishania pollutisoli]